MSSKKPQEQSIPPALIRAKVDADHLLKSLKSGDAKRMRSAADAIRHLPWIEPPTVERVLALFAEGKLDHGHMLHAVALRYNRSTWEVFESAVRSGAWTPAISPGMLDFFEVEVRNENEGGVRPATLESAYDSFQQAPDDALRSWFAPPFLGAHLDEDLLPEFNRQAAKSELKLLIAHYGAREPLMYLLNQADRDPFSFALAADDLDRAAETLLRYAEALGLTGEENTLSALREWLEEVDPLGAIREMEKEARSSVPSVRPSPHGTKGAEDAHSGAGVSESPVEAVSVRISFTETNPDAARDHLIEQVLERLPGVTRVEAAGPVTEAALYDPSEERAYWVPVRVWIRGGEAALRDALASLGKGPEEIEPYPSDARQPDSSSEEAGHLPEAECDTCERRFSEENLREVGEAKLCKACTVASDEHYGREPVWGDKSNCPACGSLRPQARTQHTFVSGSVCPHCGHVETDAEGMPLPPATVATPLHPSERESAEHAVAQGHIPCYQVEYDLNFWGGDYDEVGDFAYIPQHLVDYDDEVSMNRAFEDVTGHDAQHIVHFSWDETYTPDGDQWDEEEHGDPSAIERLLREQGEQQAVPAQVYDDRHIFPVNFDARPWLTQAQPEEVFALASCGWGGDFAADRVAQFMEDRDPMIEALLTLVRNTPQMGFECHVDARAALRWLEVHRPELAARLRHLEQA